MTDKEKVRAQMREAMPEVASVVDLFRAAGIEVRVTAAIEGGMVVGSPKALAQLEDAINPKKVCRDCLYWRKRIGDGAGVCTYTGRGTRRWLVDWPTQAACEEFEHRQP